MSPGLVDGMSFRISCDRSSEIAGTDNFTSRGVVAEGSSLRMADEIS